VNTLRTLLLSIGVALTGACATLSGQEATHAALRRATQLGFDATLIEGQGFTHDVFVRVRSSARTVWVFIEGDGSPWTDGGTKIAADPTARRPLALELALQTQDAIYLGRPCYLRAHQDTRCAPALWTEARYSDEVVASMNAALQTALQSSSPQHIVLVGYSGGGALAVLMAKASPIPTTVVTIAGNLDTDAWAQAHGYTSLYKSRNPADTASLDIPEFHLLGGRDTNVTARMTARYLNRIPQNRIWRYEKFDHVCCWSKTWPETKMRIEAVIGN